MVEADPKGLCVYISKVRRGRNVTKQTFMTLDYNYEGGFQAGAELIPVSVGFQVSSSGGSVRTFTEKHDKSFEQVRMFLADMDGYYVMEEGCVWFEKEYEAIAFKLWLETPKGTNRS